MVVCVHSARVTIDNILPVSTAHAHSDDGQMVAQEIELEFLGHDFQQQKQRKRIANYSEENLGFTIHISIYCYCFG